MTTHPPNWSCDNLQDFHVRDYNGPEPEHYNVSTARPIDYFSLYFTDEVLVTLACNTNAYAKWMIHRKCEQIPNYYDKLWSMDGSYDISVAELKAYFGILVILGLKP